MSVKLLNYMGRPRRRARGNGVGYGDRQSVVQSQFGGASEDEVDGPRLWVALADMQWTYGGLDAAVLERVRDDFASGRTLRAWDDDPRGLGRRRAVLETFIATRGGENRRPKKPPKTPERQGPPRSRRAARIRGSAGLT